MRWDKKAIQILRLLDTEMNPYWIEDGDLVGAEHIQHTNGYMRLSKGNCLSVLKLGRVDMLLP